MPGGVDAGEPLQSAGGQHGAFEVFWITEIHQERLAENIQPILVAVQFVELTRGQSVGPHLVFVHGLQFSRKRRLHFLRLRAHQGERGKQIGEVAVVAEAASEFPVPSLALVDKEVGDALEVVDVLDLEPGPLRYTCGRRRLRVVRNCRLRVPFVPVFAAEIVLGIDAQQVGHIGEEAVVGVQPLAVDVLFRHV